MTVSPRVSIIMPLFNDEEHVEAALESCLAQSIPDLEIVCVDDASTDGTAAVVERYRQQDARVRLIRHPKNRSAFQARRSGIDVAVAPYILFLDGDDQLAPRAAELTLAKASSTRSDVVGFGVEVVSPKGVPSRLAAALQPRYTTLHAPNIIPSLFPADEAPNGHLWHYLFETDLLRQAYDGFDEDAAYFRANDLPITFLALALAKKYTSISDRLYRYYFGRGTSGHAIDGLEHFRFLVSGIDPIAAIGERVRAMATKGADGNALIDCYEAARLHVIGHVLRYCMRDTSGELQLSCLALLKAHVGDLDTVRAAALSSPDALAALSSAATEPSQPSRPVQSIMLATRQLGTGGLQSVVLEQATRFANAGYRVTLAVMRSTDTAVDLPAGVSLVQVASGSRLARMDSWVTICREHEVDLIVDHHILYNENWPWLAHAAMAAGVPTIGWLHSFSLRPLFDNSQRTTFLATHLPILLKVVTLSPTDVAYWKLNGVGRVVYLPNPPSQLVFESLATGRDRTLNDERVELAWWGRLDKPTKQADQLIEVAYKLRRRGIDFRLTIIGPDSKNLSAKQLRERADARGVGDAVELLAEQTSEELLATLANSHLLVSASAIEGFQLTIVEAQALGMPVVMYDLPWLTTVRGNPGLITTTPGDPAAMADAIADLVADPQRYAELSRAARRFAREIAAVDLDGLTFRMLDDNLPDEFSPAPTLQDAQILISWLIRYGERAIRGQMRAKTRSDAVIEALRRERDRGGAGGELRIQIRDDSDADALRRDRDRLRRKLQEVTTGPSFRIGRALTLIPRKVRDRLHVRRTLRTVRPARPRSANSSEERLPSVPPRRYVKSVTSEAPDITFVVPVYNSAPWLDECISSILAQTGVGLELVCINDGSTDASRTILQRYADEDQRVTIIDQENSGQSVGRNRGLDAARGRYLIYLDSDDYWPEDIAKKLVSRADEDRLDLLLFDCLVFREGDIDDAVWKKYSRYYQRKRDYPGVLSGPELMAKMRSVKEYRPHVGLYMARTAYVREAEVRFIPGIVHQDNPYTFRLMLNAPRTGYEQVEAYARRIRPGSTITSLTAERSARGYYLSYLQMSRELESREFSAEILEPLHNIVDSVYQGARNQFAVISSDIAEELRVLDTSADAQGAFASLLEESRNTN